MTYCDKDGPLGTTKKRTFCVCREFPLVKTHIVCWGERQKTLVYVPIISVLQKLLNKIDVLNKESQYYHISTVSYRPYTPWTWPVPKAWFSHVTQMAMFAVADRKFRRVFAFFFFLIFASINK